MNAAARSQNGFTLIEVVVAFAIFAMAATALYENFAGAVRRNLQAQEREQALLVTQSVLEQQRAAPMPWKAEDSGILAGGWLWRSKVVPYEIPQDSHTPWRAVTVTVRVSHEGSEAREVVLNSVELVRITP